MPPVSVKGFAAPVRLYRALDTADDDKAGAGIVRYRRPGARIEVDFGRLAEGERNEIAKLVEELGNRLRPKKG